MVRAINIIGAGILATGLALTGPVLAQSASQVTPETFAPPTKRLSGAVVFTGQGGTKAPPGSEQIAITLSGVKVENPLPQMATAQAAFEARLTRGTISVAELFDATSDLEAAYANAGFVLSRVVLPQQALRDGGVLRVTVINGFVESIDTSRAPPEIRKRIADITKPLVGKPGLTLPRLERQLLIAGDVAGVALGSALAAGERPGGTVIALNPEYKRVTGFVGFDNLGSTELGPPTINSGIELNSTLGLGESLYARASGSVVNVFGANPRYRILAFGGLFPIGNDGLSFNLEATISDTTPNNATPTRSDYDRVSARLVYPFIRTRQLTVTGQLALDLASDRQALITGGGLTPIYEDRITVPRIGGSLSYNHKDGAQTDAAFFLSKGVDALGARTAASVGGGTPLSRQGADAVFTKLVGSASHRRQIAKNVSLSVLGRFQTSFNTPLVTSEQFSIAGASELSAFDAGTLRGDSGWVVRAELSTSREVMLGKQPWIANPYIFAGAGAVTLVQPTALESPMVRAYAYGIGVDLFSKTNSRFRSSSVRLEVGRGVRDDGGPAGTRFAISQNFRF